MKNTIRVRKNRSASRIPSQDKTPAAIPKYCLSLIEWSGPKVITHGEIDVTGLEFEILQKKSKLANDPIFNRALKNALGVMTKNQFLELDNATLQSRALLLLLAEGLDHSNQPNGSNFIPTAGPGSESFICGLQHLVWSTQDRLEKAKEAQ